LETTDVNTLLITVAAPNKPAATGAGAICTTLTNLNWVLTSVKLNAVSAELPTEEPYGITVEVIRTDPGFNLKFTTAEPTVDLEKLAQHVTTELNEVLDKSLDIELQSNFKRALQESEIQQLQSRDTGIKSKLKWFYNLFFTNHPMQPVAWIMAINIIVFVLMTFAGAGFFDTNTEVAVNWGAAWKRSVLLGEYWRLLTACFIHFGIAHLMGNLVGLLLATNMLMLIINRTQFIVGYLATGIIAMSVSMWWHTESVSAGASGAIFGCYGILLGLILTPLLNKSDRIVIAVYLLFYAGFNLLYGLKDDIDNAAHVAGLLSGIPIGLLYYLTIKYRSKKWSYAAGAFAVIVYGFVCSSFILHKTTYYGFELERLEEGYSKLEETGLAFYKTNSDSLDEQKAIIKTSVQAFDNALLVADSMVSVTDLPGPQLTYALRLREYTEYRVLEMHAIDKILQGETQWNDTLVYSRNKIDSILKVFKEDI
jgi:rhomboid protease GluP